MHCAIAHRLEGSRFGAYPATLAIFVSRLEPPKRAETGGSREQPNAMHSRIAIDWLTPGQ
jgi:hypothetical protein